MMGLKSMSPADAGVNALNCPVRQIYKIEPTRRRRALASLLSAAFRAILHNILIDTRPIRRYFLS